MGIFRITWRHEVIICADSPQEAKEIWDVLDLGKLDHEVESDPKVVISHSFVDNMSFEDENYNDI